MSSAARAQSGDIKAKSPIKSIEIMSILVFSDIEYHDSYISAAGGLRSGIVSGSAWSGGSPGYDYISFE